MLYTIYYLYTLYILYAIYTIYYILYTVYAVLYTIYYICYTMHYILYTVYYISVPLPLTPSTNVYTSFSAFVCLCLSLTLHLCIHRLLSSVSSHLSGSPLKLSFSSFPFRLSFVAHAVYSMAFGPWGTDDTKIR